MPRKILHSKSISIPDDVEIVASKRIVTVTGSRGSLKRSFANVPIDISISGKKGTKLGRKFKVDTWFSARQQQACVRTICSHVKNMINGVTKGFQFKMQGIYAHFPMELEPGKNGTSIGITNFLGERITRKVPMAKGVTVSKTDRQYEILIQGNDLEKVSQSAANIHEITRAKRKDIRKFLDGIYVTSSGFIEQK